MYFLIKQIKRKKAFCGSFTNLKYYVIKNIWIDLTSTRNPSYMIYYLSNGSTTIISALEIACDFGLKINIGLKKLWSNQVGNVLFLFCWLLGHVFKFQFKPYVIILILMLNCQKPAEDCISITDRKTDFKRTRNRNRWLVEATNVQKFWHNRK